MREDWIRRAKRRLKRVTFLLRRKRRPARPVFVMGHGRSGTSRLLDAFEHDMHIQVLKEGDARIARDFMLMHERLGPVIAASRADLVVMKPILDSFAVAELLRTHPTSKVIWMLRRFEDVTASALKKFGTVVSDDLRGIVQNGSSDTWLGRGIPQDTLARLRRLETPAFGANEWMALVWWSVNHTLRSPEVVSSDRILLVKYQTLVRESDRSMRRIYDFVGRPYRRLSHTWMNPATIGKGAGLQLAPAVRQMCEELATEIDRDFEPRESQS